MPGMYATEQIGYTHRYVRYGTEVRLRIQGRVALCTVVIAPPAAPRNVAREVPGWSVETYHIM